MNGEEKVLLLAAHADVAAIKIKVAALEELTIALAVAASGNQADRLKQTAIVMDAIKTLTVFRKGKAVADGMSYVTDSVDALTSAPPLASLAAHALLYQLTADYQKAALHTWLTQASSAEIADDLAQALKRLIAEYGPAAPESGGGGETLGD